MTVKRRRIVVKVGTSTLTNELGNSNLKNMEKLTRVLADIHNLGNEIVLVSSGAIAVGANKMRLKEKPRALPMKQAAAAVGQCENMFLYDKFFGYYDKTVAQILLNAEDIRQEEKKENLTNTFETLLEQGIIPIVNENDSVSYSEIESDEKLFSDNDVLSAVVAVLCRADLLVILSDIDGFYDRDPRLYKDARLIDRIEAIDESTYNLAGGAGSRRGTGGMRTKLQAAELAISQGTGTLVTNGNRPEVLYDVVEGRRVGTLFTARRPGDVWEPASGDVRESVRESASERVREEKARYAVDRPKLEREESSRFASKKAKEHYTDKEGYASKKGKR